jgi:hypothetical protein
MALNQSCKEYQPMKNTVKCPICETLNLETTGKSKGKLKYILSVLVMCLLVYLCFPEEFNSTIINIIPQKITSVQGMSITVYENIVFALPSKANATMSFGNKKSVNIKWSPEKIDTSTPGIKTSTGKIDGYKGTVNFNVNVLPTSIINSISNCSVNNSMIELNVYVPSNIKWIWVNIKKGTDKKDEVIPVNSGELKMRVYLPFNSGEYEISLYGSSNLYIEHGFRLWESFKVNNEDKRDRSFLLPEQYVESDSPEIIELASNIVLGLNTDRDKTLAIHDYVATHIAYDTAAYFNNNIHEYSALETLKDRKAVCNGYANLITALNRAVGIKTKYVSGTAWSSESEVSQKHAWNETYIDGRWLTQDATFDAGYIEEGEKKFRFRMSHRYFDPSISDFEKNHHKDSEEKSSWVFDQN